MTEKMDRDIQRALQSGPKGLTFTPEMQRRVLERIQAEDAAPKSPAPGRSPRPLTVPRPLLWTAVAAAALILAFRLDLGGAGGRHTAMDSTAANTEAAPQAAAASEPAPAQQQSAAPSATTTTSPTPPEQPQNKPADTGAPVNVVAPSPATKQREPVVLHLAAAASPEAASDQAAKAPEVQAPRGIATMAKARPTIRLALLPAGDEVVELNTNGLRAVLPDGSERWSAPIPELSPEARLLPAPGGRLAVVSGNTVSILTADGVLDQSFTLPDSVADLAFSPDGRTAIAGPTQVDVRKGDSVQFQVLTGSPAYVAFAANGTVAALYSAENQAHLSLRDATGQHPVDVQAPAGAHVLVVEDNSLVLAGSQAYDLNGKALWSLPFNPQGVSRLGDRLVAWDEAHAVCVDANGAVLWQTAFDSEGLALRKVVPSPDGRSLVILGATPSGGAVWVASASGQLLSAQGTEVVPVDATLADGQLAILTADSLSFTK